MSKMPDEIWIGSHSLGAPFFTANLPASNATRYLRADKQPDLERVRELLQGIAVYLSKSTFNSIGAGLVGHREIKEALSILGGEEK